MYIRTMKFVCDKCKKYIYVDREQYRTALPIACGKNSWTHIKGHHYCPKCSELNSLNEGK